MTNAVALACAALALCCACASPASATSADCDAIAEVFDRLAEVPAHRQKINDGQPDEMENVVIGDKLYTKSDGEWTALELKPGMFKQMMKRTFDRLAVTDCSAEPDDALEAGPMVVYRYVLPAMPPLVPEPVEQTLWVGAADGLPYQLDGGNLLIKISYDGVTAPVP